MVLSPIPAEKKADGRSRVDRDADNHQLLQLEEKDVVSTVATALSDICGPGEWMPMEKLHAVLLEKYANVWHHSRVRRYLTSEDWPGPESKGKPWKGIARDSYRAARNKEIQLSKEFLRGVFYSDDLEHRWQRLASASRYSQLIAILSLHSLLVSEIMKPEPPPGRAVPPSSQQPPCDAWAVDGGLGDRGEAARGAPERLGLLEARGDPRISPIRAAPEPPPGRTVPPSSQQPPCDAWAVDGGS
nr:fha domain-containing protein fha2 [Quercus suber]